METNLPNLHAQSTLGELPAYELALELATRGEVLATLFERHPLLPGVVVTEDGAVRGVLSRGQYLRLVSRYLGHEVYHPRPIRHMFEATENLEKPLVLSSATPIEEAVAQAVTRPRALLYEPVIVRHHEALRLIDFPDLLLASAHISALRNQQMRQILGTVQEGFLLVGRDERVAAEYSDWVQALFGQSPGGQRLSDLLEGLVGPEKAELGRDYLLMLFDPNVMERWVADINPLKLVEAEIGGIRRHLAFRFVRSRRQGAIDRILVRIEDQSREVELARELAEHETKARARVDLVFSLLSVDSETLAAFLASLDQALALTRQMVAKESSGERLRALARTIHAVKGEAALLGLKPLAQALHTYENLLVAARDPETRDPTALGSGQAELAALADEIRATLEQMGRLAKLARSPAGPTTAPTNAAASPRAGRLQALARHVEELAAKLGKEARFVAKVREEEIPLPYRRLLESTLLQLVRNSLVHGLEPPAERVLAGKPAAGTLQLALRRHPEAGRLELVFQDDGRGLDLDRIQRQAEKLGLLPLSPGELPGLIFHSGFSTAAATTEEAGRGVGLDLVKAEVEALGGRIVAHSRAGTFCAFQILLPDLAPSEPHSTTLATGSENRPEIAPAP